MIPRVTFKLNKVTN